MKRTVLIIILAVFTALSFAGAIDNENRLPATIQTGAITVLPIGRSAVYFDYGLGGQFTVMAPIASTPLDLSIRYSLGWLHSINPYIETIRTFNISYGIAYPIALGKMWVIAPELSGGMYINMVSGFFNINEYLPEGSTASYIDQIYTIHANVFFNPMGNGSSSGWLGFCISPAFSIYPNIDKVGMQAGLNISAVFRANNTKGRN